MRLKALLRERGITYTAINIEDNPEAVAEMKRRTGMSYTPQVFIGDKYIGGYNEFMLMDAKGEIDRLLGRESSAGEGAGEQIYDTIIIGGGPAGLTAAVYAARKAMSVVLVTDQLGGQPMWTAGVENYMGFQYITGPELMEKFEEQAKQFSIVLETGDSVSSLAIADGLKRVTTSGGKTLRGRTVIIASGKRSRKLGIPGEAEYAGRGVSYCATCDGPVFAGEKVMVAGGGNSAMQSALELAAICPEVRLVSLTELTGDEVLISKVQAEERITTHLLWQPLEIKGNGSVRSVVIGAVEGGERLELQVRGLFIEVGLQPNSSFAVDLLELNRRGEIVVDCDCRTGVQGIYAAGDVTQVRDKQIVVAAGEGCKAALSAHEYLLGLK
ncbi:MAG: FAD-dependent oxidoreductase [Thermoleophilia bacterium]